MAIKLNDYFIAKRNNKLYKIVRIPTNLRFNRAIPGLDLLSKSYDLIAVQGSELLSINLPDLCKNFHYLGNNKQVEILYS